MWLRSRLLIFVLVALLLLPPGAALAADPVTELRPAEPPRAGDAGFADETPQLWFVELAGRPTADGGRRAEVLREHDAFRGAAAAAGIRLRERFAFTDLWNGFSVWVEPRDLAALARLPGVKALYPVMTFEVPETASAAPDLATALAMTGADVAQSELGLTGEGIRVAVMDTGIDYNHPDLGGCFGEGCRVVTGWDFVGDEYDASNPEHATPMPDDDPMDCNGHGTHVAGIIGADGEVTGVAPGVVFGAYKVFGCDGSTSTDIMIAAMERALADGMDVLNMSIGAAYQWPQYPAAQASDRLVDRGVVVVASIGNSGATGVYSAGAPGVGHKVIGVASFDNSHIDALTLRVNPGDHQVPYLPLSDTDDPPTEGTTPEVVFVGRGCLVDEYLGDPAGKVALIERGACTFNEKYQRAVEAGAVAVVVHNNVPGLFAGGGVVGVPGIPGVGISQADGLHIRSLLEAGPVTLTWTDERQNAPNPTGGLISSFSSYGLAPDLTLKPDLGAPGGLIRSTYPLDKGAYAILSGTSMSSPHVAGGVALLLEAEPRLNAHQVRDVLQNSADPAVWWGIPGLGFLDNVHRQGAGMLDIPGAVQATTRVSPGKLALGESESGPSTHTLTIRNTGDTERTYALAHEPALSTGGDTFAPSFFTGFASVAFGSDTVTVPAGGSARVDVTITAHPGLPEGSLYGGYLVVDDGAGGAYRVPYAGLKGDYQSLRVLEPRDVGFPWLARLGEEGYARQEDGAVFTLADGDIPYLLVHLAHQSRRLRVEVRDAATGRNWGRAYDLEYMGRNSAPMAFFALPWDGLILRGRHAVAVPDGEYVLVLSVLKALGDDHNPDHWETWTSPTFRIQRPQEDEGQE